MAGGCGSLYTPPTVAFFGQIAVVHASELGSAAIRGAGVGAYSLAAAMNGVLCNQRIAEYTALEYTVNFVSALGWDRVGLVGDIFSVLQSFAAGKASVGLRVQNRILLRLVYGCASSERTWYLCWVPGECNPLDPFSRITLVWGGGGGGLQQGTVGDRASFSFGNGGPHDVGSACMDPGTACHATATRSCGVKGPATRLSFGELCLTISTALCRADVGGCSWLETSDPPSPTCPHPVLKATTTVNLWPNRGRVPTGYVGEDKL